MPEIVAWLYAQSYSLILFKRAIFKIIFFYVTVGCFVLQKWLCL